MQSYFSLIHKKLKIYRNTGIKKKNKILSRSILVVTKHTCKFGYLSEKIMSLFNLSSIHNVHVNNNLKPIKKIFLGNEVFLVLR
jgi:hypothetical protein